MTSDLPSAYGKDLIVLQTRDPWWIHAYWDLIPETIVSGRAQLGLEGPSAQRILRVYEESAGRWFDVPLTPEAQDWYIEVGIPDRSWTVELGLKTPSGKFVALARSNTVRTPPDRPSERIDESWGWLEALPAGWGAPSSLS